jgi:hypothetical protein
MIFLKKKTEWSNTRLEAAQSQSAEEETEDAHDVSMVSACF